MKYAFLMLLCIFNLYAKRKQQNQEVKEVTIIKTSMSMFTVADVNCDELYTLYPMDTFYIKNKEREKKIVNLINEATPCNSRPNCMIDTRAKILIEYESGKIDTLCLGYASIFIKNNKCMELPKRDLINMLIEMDR